MFFRVIYTCILFTLFVSTVSASEFSLFQMAGEPFIRIGLETNARSVSITTSDLSLVAVSPEEQPRTLAVSRVTVTARAYRPPEIETYKFEIQNLPTREEAETLAKEIREATEETATVSTDAAGSNWRVVVGKAANSIEEASEFKAALAEKGFADVVIVTEKVKQISSDAVALAEQVKNAGKSEVRSLIKPTGASQPVSTNADVANPPLGANLREVIVSGGPNAQFSSLKSVAFGSLNERAVPVRLNGKAYRGKLEVFVNSRGTLTVVNVVPIEDYLLGVVPNELSLPSLEAQKAQAVAARTYALANVGNYGRQGFDLLPTVWSQVYKGVSSENANGTRAVMETRGIVATYQGKPINAKYTSTCGGRTENSENVFDFNAPYLRGVECSLEGRRHFEPFIIKTARVPAKLRDEQNLRLARLMSLFAANGFQLSANPMTDDWFESEPTQSELSNWLNQLAVRFGETARTGANLVADDLYGRASRHAFIRLRHQLPAFVRRRGGNSERTPRGRGDAFARRLFYDLSRPDFKTEQIVFARQNPAPRRTNLREKKMAAEFSKPANRHDRRGGKRQSRYQNRQNRARISRPPGRFSVPAIRR
jgi:peptidoglycan hydrolase-like amidase